METPTHGNGKSTIIDVFSMKISISTCQVWLPDGNEPSFAMVHASPPPSRHSHDGLRHWRPGQSLRVATRAPQAFFPQSIWRVQRNAPWINGDYNMGT